MIHHLNQLGFYHYGTRESERSREEICQASAIARKVTLNWEQQTVYQAVSDTRILPDGSMTVLSVSADGDKFDSFYLDQPVCVNADIFFYLAPLRRETVCAEFCMDLEPRVVEEASTRGREHVQSNMHVSGIYTFFYQEKEKGFIFAGEQHPVLELTYVDQGVLHSVTHGQELVLEQGDMVLYGPNQWHMQYADMEVAPRYVTISFEVQDGKLESLLNRKLHPTQAGVTLIQQMIREQDRMDAYSMDMIATQLTQLLLLLLRHQEPVTKLMASNALNSENEIICRAQQYISAHIREKLSVPLVAKMVDVSPSYMTALFHKNLQISPGEYIRRVKIQESKQMIREGNMNFTQIAATLHYSTVHHFSRQFKDKVGFTPTEYAKSVR
jgi:AraC-like DNA-binding protein